MPKKPPTFGAKQGRLRDNRASACKRGYDRDWQRLRLAFLANNPLCEDCMSAGRVVPAVHVDHKVAIARGGTNDWNNLRPLCASCHSRKTAREDGGFGRGRR